MSKTMKLDLRTDGKEKSMSEVDQSDDMLYAKSLVEPYLGNAKVVKGFQPYGSKEVSLNATIQSLRDHTEHASTGDLDGLEIMLASQVVSLNTIFTEMARRAAMQFSSHVEVGEKYLRLALKAQSNCKATIETLVGIKNPSFVNIKKSGNEDGAL